MRQVDSMNNSALVAFPRTPLEGCNGPFGEPNFKCFGCLLVGGTFQFSEAITGSSRWFKGLKQKPFPGKVPGPNLGSRESPETESEQQMAGATELPGS